MRIHRAYSLALPHDGILGWGWSLAYDLRINTPNEATVTLQRGDGRVDDYAINADGTFTPPPGSVDRLTRAADGSYTLSTRDEIVYTFDVAGRLVQATDLDGNVVTLNYSGDRWTGITDAAGRKWTLACTAQNRVSAIRDPAGRVVRYAYDAAGNLQSVTNAAGGITCYAYDAGYRLTRTTDANGNLLLAHVYDDSGRVLSQTDARGVHRFTYLPGTTIYSDTLGAGSRIVYDDQYRIRRRVDPLGNATELTYATQGQVTSETNPLGGVTRYVYDAGGPSSAGRGGAPRAGFAKRGRGRQSDAAEASRSAAATGTAAAS